MPPKKNNAEVDEITMKDLLHELTAIKTRLDKVDALETKIDELTKKLDAAIMENSELKETVSKQAKTIQDLQNGLDAVERHQRSWSVRVLNVPLTTEEEKDPQRTMEKVYNILLLPILEGAKQDGATRAVPSCKQLLKTPHVLPGRDGSNKPVIVCFAKRAYKSLCFRYRRDFAPSASVRGDPERQRQLYPFFDDLTRAAASKFNELKAAAEVQSVWTINGQIRYKLKNSNQVNKITSVFEPFGFS